MIIKFITDHFIMLFELIGLLILLGISVHTPKRTRQMTLAVIILLFSLAVLFEIEAYTQTFETLSLFRPMFTACIYTFYPLILIITTQLTAEMKLKNLHAILFLLPELICIPIYFSSQWTHLVFYYHQNNHYAAGPLARLPYIIFVLYCVVFIIQNIRYLKSSSVYVKLTVSFITFSPLVGVFLFMITDYSNDYSSLFTSSLVVYYLFLYIHSARTDPLTSLLSRQSYYKDMQGRNSYRITGVISVDMNELKHINDSQGHDAGDAALKLISKTLLENRGRAGTVYRVGGDEFVIFYKGVDEKYLIKAIEDMQAAMDKTPYTCAFGYDVREPGETVEAAVRRSDTKMYENKVKMKEEALKRGEVLHPRT